MKQTAYTQGVVSVYRKYLDRWRENPSSYQVEDADREGLLELFNRGGILRRLLSPSQWPPDAAFANDKKCRTAHPERYKN